MRGKRYLPLAGFPLALSLGLAPRQQAQEDERRSVQSGVYTAEQAERGGRAYEQFCRDCHEPGAFADGVYMEGWSGESAQALIDLIRTSMPQDNPGSLKRSEYVDITAFLFHQNGLPAGDSEMDATNAKSIRIEGPYRAANQD